MPCLSGDENESYYSDYQNAGRAACEMAKLLRKNQLFNSVSKETKRWVEEHDKIDREREELDRQDRELEQLKKKALSKLTKAERELLGY